MPSVSQAQHGLMALATTQYGRAKLRQEGKKVPSEETAKEYLSADKGRKIGALAKHVRKK